MSRALDRVAAALVRAEEELPRLAAPDGTVVVRIEDLREVLNTHSSGWQDELAEALEPFLAAKRAYDYWCPEVMPEFKFPIYGTRLEAANEDCSDVIGELTYSDFRALAKAVENLRKPFPSSPSGET